MQMYENGEKVLPQKNKQKKYLQEKRKRKNHSYMMWIKVVKSNKIEQVFHK